MPNSLFLYRCSKCSKSPKMCTQKLVTIKLYYVEFYGNKGTSRVHKEDAASEWNNENGRMTS